MKTAIVSADVAKEFMRERKLVDALMDGSGKPKLFALVKESGDAKEVAMTDDIAQVGMSRAVYFIRNAASVDVACGVRRVALA